VAFRNDYLEAKWSVNPTKNATVMLCQYCEGLTLDKLLVLAKKNEAELLYECEYFPGTHLVPIPIIHLLSPFPAQLDMVASYAMPFGGSSGMPVP
jgi:hypothetical protein